VKILKRVLLLAALLGTSAVVALTLYLRSARPQVDGAIMVPGLPDSVMVLRDSLGVPAIAAPDEASLVFAQGFVHAQDRLWQMELFRRVAEGRLADILGPGLVATDRFLRTAGVWRAAARQEQATPPGLMRLLDAYAAGVNAWIETHRGALPPEFELLRVKPEPWTPRHSLALEKIMAWDLSAYGSARQAAQAAHTLAPDRMEFLNPDYPAWGPTIIDGAVPPPVPQIAARWIESVSISHASNAWVIGGARTRSGRPVLANDMHLALRAPAIWQLMALHGGGVDVAGMTLPGAPFVVAGHNRAVAWGYTNAMVDDIDFFAERIDPADPGRYLVPGGSEPFQVIHERIAVRGADTVSIDIRLTRHGPVLDDEDGRGAGIVFAMAWAAADPSSTFTALRDFNRATGAADVIAATVLFDDPHQNVVYADTAGNFGYRMAGRVPVRGAGLNPPLAPVPGWTGEWDWNGYLPPDQHPALANPERGYVVTANNRQVAGDQGDRISQSWEPPFRAARITQMIEQAGAPLDADAVHAMQLDTHDALADRYVRLAIATARAAHDTAAERTLADWDRRADRASTGAALFYAWLEELRARLSAALHGDENGWLPRVAFYALLDSASLPWLATAGGGAFDALAQLALEAAAKTARGHAWGDLHRVASIHALSDALPLLQRLLRLDVGHVAGNGANTTVNVSQYGGRFPLDADYGPSERHVVDLADVDGSGGFILPTGESGIPFDRHYRDQFERWLGGGLWLIPVNPDRAAPRAVHRLVLEPAVH
jgi:penicillin amidase